MLLLHNFSVYSLSDSAGTLHFHAVFAVFPCPLLRCLFLWTYFHAHNKVSDSESWKEKTKLFAVVQ